MPCSPLLECWVLILFFVGTGEEIHLQRLVDQSAPLAIGATEDDVLRLIGEPRARWGARGVVATFILGKRPAQWIYGTTIDIESIIIPGLPFPNPVPIKIRLLDADRSDLVIDWTPDKRISGVSRPELDIPDGIEEFCESLYFFLGMARESCPDHDFRQQQG